MKLIDDLENGCVYIPKRWSGDCGEFSRVDEGLTDTLLLLAAERIKALEAALQKIVKCDWPGSAPGIYSRADWMQQIAREALEL
jgi:hypothetical protein